MNRYKVVAANLASGIVALQDDVGKCHLGRALEIVPRAGDVLRGPELAIGIHPLKLEPAEHPCTVALVLLDCNPASARMVVSLGTSPATPDQG